MHTRLVYRFLFACLLMGVSVVLAQAQPATTRKDAHPKALKDFKAGVQASFERQDKTAVKYFEAAIQREPNFADALLELAGAHYNTGDFSSAEEYLERVAKLDGSAGIKGLYGLAMAEMKQEKYGEAIPHLQGYLESGKLNEDRRKAAENFLLQATFREKALKNPVDFKLERLPLEINSLTDSEYLPSFTADENTLIFARNVGGRQEDFFVSYRDTAGNWTPAQPVSSLNTDGNDAGQTLSADGKLMVFTGCDREGGKVGATSCDLYYATLLPDGTWTEPRNLGAPINTKAWESQPSLAANGNLLFFASKREGGLGGSDVYASGRTPNGGWTEPMNLGPIINTAKDDQTPFFHADGKTLYFMSIGHPGMGGFDLFKTQLGEDNVWTTPQNLGYPINTENSEGALVVALDGKTAYFATDNETAGADSIGVGGQKGGSTDLFQFTLPPDARAGVVTYLRARVLNAETKEPVAAAALFTDAANDKPFLKRRADAEKGEFLAVLPSGKTYALTVEEPGYLF
ncbi:MAG: tetratricopeptide repeat protein, partial [Saprospiraceae bacterium]